MISPLVFSLHSPKPPSPTPPPLPAASYFREETDTLGWARRHLLTGNPTSLPKSVLGPLLSSSLQQKCPRFFLRPTLPRGQWLPHIIQGSSWLKHLAPAIILSLLYRQFLHLYNLLPIIEMLFSSSPSLNTKPTKPLPWPHFSSIYHPISLLSFTIKCLNIRSSHFFFSLLLNSLSKITSSLHLTKSVANSV